ncbi:MAG TPA: hypothetical protein VF789_08595 [Thermoanaerobaculia bacterium]
MATRSERLNRLVISSPCQESWQTMNGGESTRFCSRCQKRVYDLAALEAREIEALVQATQGRLCARITRDRSGRIVTREPEAPPFHLPDAAPARRASPMIAAVVTAMVGMTGAGWAQAPASAPAAAAPATPDPEHPSGPGGTIVDGQVEDDQDFAVETATLGVIVVDPVDLPLDAVFQQSHVVVAAVVGPSVTIEEPDAGDVVRHVRTELRITSVLKGKPRGGTLQIDHYVIPGEPGNFSPGDVVLALLDPLDHGDGKPGSPVYTSVDPFYDLRPIPPYPRLRPELGVDEAGWQAMSYIANALDNDALQELVTRAITQLEEAHRQLAGDEKRLRARTAAIEEKLRRRFVKVLNGES